MGEFSLTHLLIVALILLVFFGPSRLPKLGKSLGEAIRGFKEGMNEAEKAAQSEEPRKPVGHLNPGQSETANTSVSDKNKTQS